MTRLAVLMRQALNPRKRSCVFVGDAADHLVVEKDVGGVRRRRIVNDSRAMSNIVPEIQNDDTEGIEAVLARFGAARQFLHLFDGPRSVIRLAVMRNDRWPDLKVEFVLTRAYEIRCRVDDRQAYRDGVVRSPVNGEVTRVELVIKPRQRLDMCCHTGFCL